MALKTLVKLGKVNNLSDARYAAGMGVEMLGFCLEETSRDFISPPHYQEITGWLSGVKLVGEFEKASLDEMNAVLSEYPVHAIQIAREDILEKIHQSNQFTQNATIPIIFTINTTTVSLETMQAIMGKYQGSVQYFLLESQVSEDISEEDLLEVKKLSFQYPIILGYGLKAQNIESILNITKLRGIALEGGHEIRPGLKDFDSLAEILETLEVE